MSTVGPAVPTILIPRFTSYLGEGTYTTVPLDVSAYNAAHVTLWRGKLIGDTGSGAEFECSFEESQDAETWTQVEPAPPSPPISTVNTSSDHSIGVTRRWLRVKIELTGDASDVVGITCWATGLLEERIR